MVVPKLSTHCVSIWDVMSFFRNMGIHSSEKISIVDFPPALKKSVFEDLSFVKLLLGVNPIISVPRYLHAFRVFGHIGYSDASG